MLPYYQCRTADTSITDDRWEPAQPRVVGGSAAIGQVLDGRYRIVAKLGEGGMGEVYAAEHVHIEKRVAIKLLRRDTQSNPEAVIRFRQEARSASSIGHRNIIGIEDFGALPDGRIYLCMELLAGQSLGELIKRAQPPERLLDILVQTCRGLAAAHAKDIVHRDMKPENILVTDDDGHEVPKVLDFGIAKVAQPDGGHSLTRVGAIFGTPFYMSPEQALGQPVCHRTDIYAMGVIVYEAFCGAVPFGGDSFVGVLAQHVNAVPATPSVVAERAGRRLPKGLERVIARAMHKNPEHRYATADAMADALLDVRMNLSGATVQAPRSGAPVPRPVPRLRAAASATTQSREIAEAPRRTWPWVAIIAAVLALLLGGGAAVYAGASLHPLRAAAAAANVDLAGGSRGTPDAEAIPVTMQGPSQRHETQLAATMPVTASDDAPPPAARQVTIVSRGASFYVGGRRIGRGKHSVAVHPGRKLTVLVRRRGYRSRRVVIDGSDRVIRVRLRKHKDEICGLITSDC